MLTSDTNKFYSDLLILISILDLSVKDKLGIQKIRFIDGSLLPVFVKGVKDDFRALRVHLGLSQSEMSAYLVNPASQGFVSDIERGKRMLSLHQFEALKRSVYKNHVLDPIDKHKELGETLLFIEKSFVDPQR